MAGRSKKKQPKLKVPYCPDGDDKGHFEVRTLEEKAVSDYTGYNFDRLNDLDIFQFWLLLHDAAVYNCQQTQEGRDYLEKCWLAEQTEPDRAELRKRFKKN